MSGAIDYMANAHTALEGTPDELEALEFPDLPEFDFADFAQAIEDAKGE